MDEPVFCILLVEDHPADVLLIRKAIKRLAVLVDLHVAVDGHEAVAFLRKQGHYQLTPRPDIVLLDLNMPRRDGRSVLREIKGDAELRVIPIIVLTTSAASTDIQLAYDLHANGYVVKPLAFEDFMVTLEAIASFWLTIAHLPPPSSS